MASIETALGPIEPAALGFTLSHEHIRVDMPLVSTHYPWLFDAAAARERMVRELREAKAGGVDAVIDLTTPDLGRNIPFVADVSRASAMHVVVATGLWLDIPRHFRRFDADDMADIFVREIEQGIADSGVRAGVIKVATDAEGVTPLGELVLRGAARALNRTGCPISTHHWAPGEVARQQLAILSEEGAPLDRVCIGHSADSTDVEYLHWLLQQGVYVSMDRYPGVPGQSATWRERNATVQALVDRGWAHRLMLGHDYDPMVHDPQSPTRYLFVSTVAIPALRESGVDQASIDLMTRDAPRRFLAGEDA